MQLGDYFQKNKYGVYLLQKDDYDFIAKSILETYLQRSLLFPQVIDVELLATEGYFIDIKYETLEPNGRVLGAIAFDDSELVAVDHDGTNKVIPMEYGTMLVDMSLIKQENKGRRRFTIAHELSHFVLHRTYHSPINQEYQLRKNKPMIACRSESMEQYKKNGRYKTTEEWVELQADKLAAAILMPKELFVIAGTDVLKRYGVRKDYLVPYKEDKYLAKCVIKEIANIFDVSFRAAQIRMINTGLIRKYQ